MANRRIGEIDDLFSSSLRRQISEQNIKEALKARLNAGVSCAFSARIFGFMNPGALPQAIDECCAVGAIFMRSTLHLIIFVAPVLESGEDRRLLRLSFRCDVRIARVRLTQQVTH
jgi:hypothetical protein